MLEDCDYIATSGGVAAAGGSPVEAKDNLFVKLKSKYGKCPCCNQYKAIPKKHNKVTVFPIDSPNEKYTEKFVYLLEQVKE